MSMECYLYFIEVGRSTYCEQQHYWVKDPGEYNKENVSQAIAAFLPRFPHCGFDVTNHVKPPPP